MAQNHALSPLARALRDDEMQLALNRNEPLAYALFMLFRWGSCWRRPEFEPLFQVVPK